MAFLKCKIISGATKIWLFKSNIKSNIPCSVVIWFLICTRKVHGSNPLKVKGFFFYFVGYPGSNPIKKGQLFNTFQHTCHTPQGLFLTTPNNPRGVGSGGKRQKFV